MPTPNETDGHAPKLGNIGGMGGTPSLQEGQIDEMQLLREWKGKALPYLADLEKLVSATATPAYMTGLKTLTKK